ncbi:TIGR02597 family protein [archaeon]|nr:MAG: TIGR02597 family protein [archaeon]
MNSSRLGLQRLAVALLSLAPLSTPLFAQTTATTDPVGFITLNIDGTQQAGSTALSFKGLGLTRPVEYQGSAETVGTNTLIDNEAVWTDNQFNGQNGSFYVELTSGPGAGTTYDVASTSAATKTITLAQNLATGVTNGATFKIRKHWTVASVFGTANEAGLAAGDLNTADQILLYNGTGYDIYYYQTSAIFGNGWRNANNPGQDASGAKIYPDDGVIIKRQQASPVNVVLMGAVKTGQSSIPVLPGTNIVSNVYAAPMTLTSSLLFTNNPSTGVASGDSGTADHVMLWNGTSYDIYYYQTSAILGNGWRNASNPGQEAGSTPIPVGASIIIKRNGSQGFDWKAPQHPASL